MQSHDDRLTFLLPSPLWVNDFDVAFCASCNAPFSTLKRRHHCRNCGNIFCHECSARKVPLPQLGYGVKPVRVCNGCFNVSYLVYYAIDVDHGLSTQMHGVRGLLELVEKDDEKDLHNMVAYGGIDALIWLCRSSKDIQLHHLATTNLAMLTEKESIRPVIITKYALLPLLYLIRHYTQIDQQQYQKQQEEGSEQGNSTSSNSSIYSPSELSLGTKKNIQLEIIINCAHVIHQLSRAGILTQRQEVIDDGVFDVMLNLASFDLDDKSDDQLTERISIIQTLAAKTISCISSLVSLQPSIIELLKHSNKLANLLNSSNQEVRRYIAKTVAFLSLRNNKYKPILLEGDGSRALVSIIALLPQTDDDDDSNRLKTLRYYLARDITDDEIETIEKTNNAVAVSHVCCAMANFATNNESQLNLMSQPHLLRYICNVPAVFTTHIEIHKHVVRCLANLSLYEENTKKMLTKDKEDSYNILPTLIQIGNQPNVTGDIQRQIIRAIDNLSSKVPVVEEGPSYWRAIFGDLLEFINTIRDIENQDPDVVKRATDILERAKIESTKPMILQEENKNDEEKENRNKKEKEKEKEKEQDNENKKNDKDDETDLEKKQVEEEKKETKNNEDVVLNPTEQPEIDANPQIESEEQSVIVPEEERPTSSPEITKQNPEDKEVENIIQAVAANSIDKEQSKEGEEEAEKLDEEDKETLKNESSSIGEEGKSVKEDSNAPSDDLLESQTDDSKKTQPTPVPGTNKPKNKKKNRKHK